MNELNELELERLKEALTKMIRWARELTEAFDALPEKIKATALLVADVESAFQDSEPLP